MAAVVNIYFKNSLIIATMLACCLFVKFEKIGIRKQVMKKILVIGAGPAGLTTAYELLKSGADEFSVTVFS